MTSLWRNVSVNVVANSIWSCLLISAAKVHWRVQPTAARRSGMQLQIQQDAWGSARIARVSQQCLHENVQKILEKEQWPSSNSPNLNGMEISCLCMSDARSYILKPSSEAQNGFWIISRTENILDNFPQVQIIKLCRALQIAWQEYICEQWRKIFYMSIRLYSKKVFALTAFALSWIVETIFGNVSTAKFPWLKAAYNVVNFADNILKLSTFTDNWMNNHCVKFYIIPLYIVLEKLAKFCIGDTFWRARGSTETYINYSIMNAQNIWSAISVEINFENRSTNCWNSELLLFRCPTPRQLDWIRPDAQSIESGRCVHALIQFFSGVQLLINGIGTWYPGDTCSVGYWLHCALAMRRSVL